MIAGTPNQPKVGLALGSGSARGWSHIGLLEFYRAEESIEEGQACVHRMAAEISRVMKQL